MYEEGIVAQSDVEHRCACRSDIFLKHGFVFFLSTSVLQNLMSLLTHTCIYCLLFHVLEQFP